MIVVKISGGFGEQLAMYAFGLRCARMLGVELKLDLIGVKTDPKFCNCLDHFSLQADYASDEEIAAAKQVLHVREEKPYFAPDVLDGVCDGCYLEGAWQDYRYSEPVIKHLRESFLLTLAPQPEWKSILDSIQSCQSVSMHIWRQKTVDDLDGDDLPASYYEDAIKAATVHVQNPHFFVFSNDVEWARRHVNISADHTWVDVSAAFPVSVTFECMRACRHHINSNTPMSVWAAWMGQGGGKTWTPQSFYGLNSPIGDSRFGEVRQPVWPAEWTTLPARARKSRSVDFTDIPGGDCSHRPICVAVTGLYESLLTQGLLFKQNNAPIGADLLKPWVELHRYGLQHGFKFVTPDELESLDEVDAVMILDRPDPQNLWAQQLLERPIVKYLVIAESEVIRPQNWDRAYHEQFDRIFTWADDWVDNVRYIKFNTSIEAEPVLDFKVAQSAFEQRKLVTMIAGGKLAKHPNELYSQRIQGIQWFEANAPEQFDLYGQGWPDGYFKTYRGPVEDKLLTLGQYRFCICFENAQGFPGYITEKLLDCFLAGVVPIYWGAPNITDWVPQTCFIDFKAFNNWELLYEHLASMTQETYNEYLDAIESYLQSPAVYPFTIDSFISNVTGRLAHDVKKRQGKQPRMSVVIPTYNHGKYIQTAISSVLSQNVEDLELLIIDNASTDDTPVKVRPYLNHPCVRYLRQNRNVGAPSNWYTGVTVACGEALAILSSDDFFLEGHLQRALLALDGSPRAGLVYCPVICVDENDKPTKLLAHPGHPQVDYCGGRNEVLDLLSLDCYITPSAAVIRMDALEKAGGLNIRLRAAIDWDMWIRIAAHGGDFVFFRLPSVCYRFHGEQDTSRAVTAGDMLRDHLDILNHQIQRAGLGAFAERKERIARLLQWRMMYQAGSSGQDIMAQANELLQTLLTAPVDTSTQRLHP